MAAVKYSTLLEKDILPTENEPLDTMDQLYVVRGGPGIAGNRDRRMSLGALRRFVLEMGGGGSGGGGGGGTDPDALEILNLGYIAGTTNQFRAQLRGDSNPNLQFRETNATSNLFAQIGIQAQTTVGNWEGYLDIRESAFNLSPIGRAAKIRPNYIYLQQNHYTQNHSGFSLNENNCEFRFFDYIDNRTNAPHSVLYWNKDYGCYSDSDRGLWILTRNEEQLSYPIGYDYLGMGWKRGITSRGGFAFNEDLGTVAISDNIFSRGSRITLGKDSGSGYESISLDITAGAKAWSNPGGTSYYNFSLSLSLGISQGGYAPQASGLIVKNNFLPTNNATQGVYLNSAMAVQDNVIDGGTPGNETRITSTTISAINGSSQRNASVLSLTMIEQAYAKSTSISTGSSQNLPQPIVGQIVFARSLAPYDVVGTRYQSQQGGSRKLYAAFENSQGGMIYYCWDSTTVGGQTAFSGTYMCLGLIPLGLSAASGPNTAAGIILIRTS